MRVVHCDRSYAEPMLAILNDLIVNTTVIYDYAPRTPAAMDTWFDAKERGRYPVIGLVDDDGTLAGFGTYGAFRNWAGYKYSVEHSIYLQASYRGRGLGKTLLQAIIDAAQEQQYHVLIGGIDSTNAASIGLHERFGFERCATVRHAGYKFGGWLDLLLYQLILPTPDRPVET